MQKAFFLGPPLPLDGRLYQLAEVEDEVRLLVLDAATGKKLWQQQLAVIGQSAEYERRRRIGGISPSYAHGVLFVPRVSALWCRGSNVAKSALGVCLRRSDDGRWKAKESSMAPTNAFSFTTFGTDLG